MADTIKFTCTKETRLLFASITEKSAPPTVQNAVPKFSGVFGLGAEDYALIVPLEVQAILSETGTPFTNANDYYLACMSGAMAAARVRATAQLNASAARMKDGEDAAFKILEKAEKRAVMYEGYAGILSASSQYDVELGWLSGGVIKDIGAEPHARAQAGKDMFYAGAYVVPAIGIKGFRRKTLDAKDGCTAYLQNVLFLRKGEKIAGAAGVSNQDAFSTFKNYSDYDPTAMAPGAADFSSFTGGAAPSAATAPAMGTQTAAFPSSAPPPPPAAFTPPPPPPVVDPNRPVDPAYRHDNGDGTEQWHVNGAWDQGKHPVPAMMPPPPPAAGFGGLPVGAPGF